MRVSIEITKRPTVHPEELSRLVRAAFEGAVPLIEMKVRDHTPEGVLGESGLKGSIFSQLRAQPAFMVSLTSSNLPHAAPVEFGRRAGSAMPPVTALIKWVEKFISLKQGDTAKGVAFAIARYMAQRGSRSWRSSPPGARMFERGAEASWPLVERIFADHLRDGVVRLVRN
jgi:hypothetical protein